MTAPQATKQLLDMGCQFISIVDLEGIKILPHQQNKFTAPADIKKQAEKVNTYLKTAPPGIYIIEGKVGSTSKATQMLINVGNVVPANVNNVQQAQPMAEHSSNSVLSYTAALDMQNQIANLTSENNRLRDLVEALEGDLADIDEAQPAQMAESPAMGALGQLAAILPAVVDKWFENQKENREIEKAKLYQAMQSRQAQHQSNGNSDYGSL